MVALLFAIPIAVWSPIGKSIFGALPSTPFGLRIEIWQLLLSLAVVFYSSQIFFVGAYHAVRAKTLDMMVLVAVALGTGWVYSVVATFWIRGDVFYEASAFLASFVLLGHWFEMRARGGANDAMRALLATGLPSMRRSPPHPPLRHIGAQPRTECGVEAIWSSTVASATWRRRPSHGGGCCRLGARSF
jgi:P-type Cu2+ transporter